MTLRRDFLAFTAGAIAARTVLPLAAKAEPAPHRWPDTLFPPGQHPRLDPHPDAALLVAIEEFKALEWQYLGLYEEGATTFIEDQAERDKAVDVICQAQKPWLEVICSTRATTLHGLKARVGCILLEDQELDPFETAASGEFQNERLLAALLRDLAPGRVA